jgi:hypothetical protein
LGVAALPTNIFTNLGHGTGTLGILAGAKVDGAPLGGAPFADVIPIRVANSVVLFENSAIAKALDYVHRKSEQPEENMKISTNAVNLSRCSL